MLIRGWVLGCQKQVQSEREEAERVCCRDQMDDRIFIFNFGNLWELGICLHGSEQQLSRSVFHYRFVSGVNQKAVARTSASSVIQA